MRIARAVADHGSNRKPGSQQRPALVLLDRDPHRHALHDLGELAGDDVPRHQGELGPGRFVDPDDPAAKWLGEGVHVQFHRVARRHAAQPRLFQIGRHVEQVGVVHAQDRHARRGEIAEMAVALDHHARERGADLRVLELVLGRGRAPCGLRPRPSFLTAVSNSTSRIWALPVSARSTPLLAF